MCDPVIAGGAMLAMSGIQAYTQYQQGKYTSKVAEANADIATAQGPGWSEPAVSKNIRRHFFATAALYCS
ncbi:hypothetical protein ACX3VG_18460, partial [Escherichia coli]